MGNEGKWEMYGGTWAYQSLSIIVDLCNKYGFMVGNSNFEINNFTLVFLSN